MTLLGRGNKRGASSVPTQMPSNPAISPRRRLAGAAALATTAGGLAAIAAHDVQWVEWGLLAYAGIVGVAAVGLARRSMTAQVLSRATAWTVLTPSLLVAVISTLTGRPEWMAAALAAGSGGALVLARPMIHGAEAKAKFAPTSFRRWLLASATASATAGMVTGLFALESLRWQPVTAIPLLALSLSLIGAAVGVVRMRAWGILLGGLTSVVTLIAATLMHDPAGVALLLTTLPGFMLLLPVVLAKRDRARDEAERRHRIATLATLDATTPRLRVATDATDASGSPAFDAFDDEFESDGDTTATPAPAARAQA
jgi:hypothetical protein